MLRMTGLGQTQSFGDIRSTFALDHFADSSRTSREVRKVPYAVVSNRNKVPCTFFSRSRIVQATKEHQRVGAVCVEPILGSKRRVRLVYCCVSPHPTKGRRRSCARNCRRSPAAVRGSAREPPSAGDSAAVVRHLEIRTAPG